MSAIDFKLKQGDVIANRFEIDETLGSGGMGVVYRAFDLNLGRQVVALKVLYPEYANDEELFQRFSNEVRIARQLSHRNIIRIHDLGKDDSGISYISMEYVDGEGLRAKIKRLRTSGGPGIPWEESLELLRQILQGIAYAHKQGVIHRDLKPENILVTKDGTVKIADFGTAWLLQSDTRMTQIGQIIGTPGYISPEQIRGDRGGILSDVYALGMIAYELLSGRSPFRSKTFVELISEQLNEHPLLEFDSSWKIPTWFSKAVTRAAAPKPEDRFSSTEDFLQALEAKPTVAHAAGKQRLSWVALGGCTALLLAVFFLFPGLGPEKPSPKKSNDLLQNSLSNLGAAINEKLPESRSNLVRASKAELMRELIAFVEESPQEMKTEPRVTASTTPENTPKQDGKHEKLVDSLFASVKSGPGGTNDESRAVALKALEKIEHRSPVRDGLEAAPGLFEPGAQYYSGSIQFTSLVPPMRALVLSVKPEDAKGLRGRARILGLGTFQVRGEQTGEELVFDLQNEQASFVLRGKFASAQAKENSEIRGRFSAKNDSKLQGDFHVVSLGAELENYFRSKRSENKP